MWIFAVFAIMALRYSDNLQKMIGCVHFIYVSTAWMIITIYVKLMRNMTVFLTLICALEKNSTQP